MLFADINEQGARDSAEKSKDFAKNPHYRAITARVDVTNPESVQNMVDTTIKEFGRIDCSVNCAGVSQPAVRFDLSPSKTNFWRVNRWAACQTLQYPI